MSPQVALRPGRPKHTELRSAFEVLAIFPGNLRFFTWWSEVLRTTPADEVSETLFESGLAAELTGEVYPSIVAIKQLGWARVSRELVGGRAYHLTRAIVCRRLRITEPRFKSLLARARHVWPDIERIYDEYFWCARIIEAARNAPSEYRDAILDDYEGFRARWPDMALRNHLRDYLHTHTGERQARDLRLNDSK